MYFPENMEELERIKTECMQLVNKRAVLSSAAAVIPLPGVDISADITIMVELLTEINKKGTTILMVTHDHNLVRDFQHRVIMLDSGKIIADNVGGDI